MALSVVALFLPGIVPLGIVGWLMSIAATIFYVSEWMGRKRRVTKNRQPFLAGPT